VPDVEQRLHQLGARLQAELADRDVVPTVVDTIQRNRAASATRSRHRVRRIAVMAALGLAVTTAAASAAETIVFDSGAETVQRRPAPTTPRTPPTPEIDLGRPVSLEHARTLPGFLEPHVPWLDGAPTAWVDDDVPRQLTLSYPPGPALPEVAASHVGLIVQTFGGDGHEAIRKYLTNDTEAERIRIRGAEGVFLHGDEHTLFYLGPDGKYVSAPGRLVGNALIFSDGRLTVRVEADLPRARLVALAISLSADD
jgi:hypothetical protein